MALVELIREQQRLIAVASRELNVAAEEMATALMPRLHRLDGRTLADLKKALQPFNAKTRRWKTV